MRHQHFQVSIAALMMILSACNTQHLNASGPGFSQPKSLKEIAALKLTAASLPAVAESKQPVFKKSLELTYVNEKGVVTPVTPEMLNSIEIVSQYTGTLSVQDANSFGTKQIKHSKQTSAVFEKGKFTLLSNQFFGLNGAVAKFHLINAKTPLVVPMLANLYGGNNDTIKATIDKNTGSTTVRYVDATGNPNNSIPALVLQGDKVSVIVKDTQGGPDQSAQFDIASKTPVAPVVMPVEPNLNQILKNAAETKAPSNQSIFGQWLFSGFGQNIILSITSDTNASFKATANLNDKTYQGTARSDSGDPKTGYSFSTKLGEENLKVKLTQTSTDAINLTLSEVPDSSPLKGFLNAPFTLTRIGSKPVTPSTSALKDLNDINDIKNMEEALRSASPGDNAKINQVLNLGAPRMITGLGKSDAEDPFLNQVQPPVLAPVVIFQGANRTGDSPVPPPVSQSGTVDRIVVGTAGNDKIIVADARNTKVIVGESGDYSLVKLGGSATNYSVTVNNGHAVISDNTSHKVTDISKIQYVTLDQGKIADYAKDSVESQIMTLYQVAFGRPAEPGDLNYWFDLGKAGVSLKQIATAFTNVTEFSASNALSNRDFVQMLYQNAFGRAGEDAGVQYWVDALAKGATRADLILQFSQVAFSTLNPGNVMESQLIGNVTIVTGIL